VESVSAEPNGLQMAPYRRLSLWWDTLPGPLLGSRRPALDADTDADVAIVGAGFTGLWAAYYLAKADPSLRVVVVEKETAGFGASGRNGGWCSALFPASWAKIARESSRADAVRMQRAMFETVDEVGAVVGAEGLDVHWTKGGTVGMARTPTQVERARAEIDQAREWGFGADDYAWLSAGQMSERIGATAVRGGTYTPHTAAIHPARLARGLAQVVERLGVRLVEGTAAIAVEPGVVRTPYGVVRAEIVLRATEGYTPSLPGLRRELAPVYSLMLATEPLPTAFWERAGLARRETFNDHRHLIIYGQRTLDDRFAFGGRGAPYHFGSSIRPEFDREPAVFAELRRVLVELFPAVADFAVTHTWGGPLGVPRDWFASVGLDRRTGLGWAGGYVGDGVGTTNLAGRTLADLVLERRSDLVTLPWVGHRSPRWEPEPLRFLGVNAGLRVMGSADYAEARSGRQSRRAALFGRFTGH
jgi:glycine/D-amino acid oxidase-like deaminating enzyme